MFLEFAAGLREYKCSPWSTVTYTPHGWKGPCYLIGKTCVADVGRVLERHGLGVLGVAARTPLCQNCAMHSGFEASVVHGAAQASGRHGPDDRVEPARGLLADVHRGEPGTR